MSVEPLIARRALACMDAPESHGSIQGGVPGIKECFPHFGGEDLRPKEVKSSMA